jgi:hypothetical protein
MLPLPKTGASARVIPVCSIGMYGIGNGPSFGDFVDGSRRIRAREMIALSD